jgi:hypothetical protein
MKLYSKCTLMSAVIKGIMIESFEHSVDGHFNITAMRKFAVDNKIEISTFYLNVDVVNTLVNSRVVDQSRIMALSDSSWQFDPGLIVEHPPENQGDNPMHTVIDGAHRIIRRAIEKCDSFDCYVFTPAQIIRPDFTVLRDSKELGIDWGDEVVGDKIVKRV